MFVLSGWWALHFRDSGRQGLRTIMTIQLHTYTVAELHAQLQALIDKGEGTLPVCATDCRGRYPFQAYTVLNQSGYTDALLIYVRPDAHFEQRDPLPINWGPNQVHGWNEEADTIKRRCGAFSDKHHEHALSYSTMKAALEKIWDSGHPDADEHVPEFRGLSEGAYAVRLVEIAGEALGRR